MSQTMTAPSLAQEARLVDPSFYADNPFPTYARMRREAPVYWCAEGNFWALSKYDDIRFVGRNSTSFTTRKGNVIAHHAARRSRHPEGVRHLQLSDKPLHTDLRRITGTVFSPGNVRGLERAIRRIVTDTLDAIEPGSHVNVVDALSAPVPIYVIATLLGLPREEWETFRMWSDSLVLQIDTSDPEAAARHRANVLDAAAYFVHHCTARVGREDDELLSLVANGVAEGKPLSPEEWAAYCQMLVVAGNETTRNSISGGTRAFGLHGDQWQLLKQNPDLTGSAVDEVLRWVSPVHAFCRSAAEEVVIRDQQIKAGDFVVMLYPSANRDEDVWDCPDHFDIARTSPAAHIAFGFGPHVCLGSALARLELVVVFQELARRFPDFELTGPAKTAPSSLVFMIEELPVTFR